MDRTRKIEKRYCVGVKYDGESEPAVFYRNNRRAAEKIYHRLTRQNDVDAVWFTDRDSGKPYSYMWSPSKAAKKARVK